MNEYLIKYKIGTKWHEPHNTTTYNLNTEIVEANNGREAVQKIYQMYPKLLSNPNKSIEIITVKKL